ncbi:peroxidase, partial [Morganella morganii]
GDWVCYLISRALSGAMTFEDEVHCFRYMAERAIIGFIEVKENPEFVDERKEYAVIGGEDPEFAGDSYAFVQKYNHDMDPWQSVSTEDQERVIGRHTFNDV